MRTEIGAALVDKQTPQNEAAQENMLSYRDVKSLFIPVRS
jgi:hypothetical protein